MSDKPIDFTLRRFDKRTKDLHDMGKNFDNIILKVLGEGADIEEVAGVLAHRLGEIIRAYPGNKETLLSMCQQVLETRAYYE